MLETLSLWWLQSEHEQQGKTGLREGVTEEGSINPFPVPPLEAAWPVSAPSSHKKTVPEAQLQETEHWLVFFS